MLCENDITKRQINSSTPFLCARGNVLWRPFINTLLHLPRFNYKNTWNTIVHHIQVSFSNWVLIWIRTQETPGWCTPDGGTEPSLPSPWSKAAAGGRVRCLGSSLIYSIPSCPVELELARVQQFSPEMSPQWPRGDLGAEWGLPGICSACSSLGRMYLSLSRAACLSVSGLSPTLPQLVRLSLQN